MNNKNEEKMLGKWLDSIKGVDEIVIVDTGSTDKSIEIAKSHGAKVYTDYKWQDDFSAARNVAKAKCSGEWLLIIDGDEVLQSSIPAIRKFLDEPFMKSKDLALFYVTTGKESNVQPRLFRNRPDVMWYGAAHNQPCVQEGNKLTNLASFKDLVYQSTFKIKANLSPNHAKDPDRSLRIMSQELAKGIHVLGNAQYTRYLYYIAREWLNRRDPIKAMYFLQDYVKIAPPTNEMADAWFLLASCDVDLGRLEDAVDACFQCVKYQPENKAAWAMVHNLSHPEVQYIWERVFHMVKNQGVLFKRPEAEKLYKHKPKKK